MIDEEFLDRLVRASPVRLYASGIDGARCYWPWRMNKANAEADARHAAKCDHYVVDSNFKDPSVTNEDVLDEATKLGADAAVLADVYQDCDSTVDALLEGLETADDHRFGGTVVLPLQAPHVKCYRELADSVDTDVWWAVGGLKDEPAAAKIAGARSLRDEVGAGPHIHGLGFGVTAELARVVRADPGLLDSVDNATAMSNSVSDLPGKTEKMTVAAAYATAKRLEALRTLTPFADVSPDDLRERDQTGLEGFA